jgi:multidrug transporter EmrE-like cation transporter
MWNIEWIPLGFGLSMAGIDVFMLSLIKSISMDGARMIRWMVLPTILYALQPWIFLHALKYESLVVMNLLWDVLSDVLVTLVGFFYFGEKVGPLKKIGVVLSLVSIFLLTAADGDGL